MNDLNTAFEKMQKDWYAQDTDKPEVAIIKLKKIIELDNSLIAHLMRVMEHMKHGMK